MAETLPPVVAQVLGDVSDFVAKMSQIKEMADNVSGTYTADVKVEDADAVAKFADINAILSDWDHNTAAAKIDLGGWDETNAKLGEIISELHEINDYTARPKVKVDTGGSGGTADLGGLVSWLVALGPALNAIGAVGLGSIALLPGILGGIGLAGGAAAAGVVPVVHAITDLNQVQTDLQSHSKNTAADLAIFKGALTQLSPAAQQIVQIFGNQLIPLWDNFKKADEQALFSGAVQGIQNLIPLFQDIEPYIIDAAKGLGDWFTGFTKILSSRQGLSDLNNILSSGLGFMKDLGGAADDVTRGFLNLGSQGTPLLAEFGQSIQNVATDFAKWTNDGGSQKFLAYIQSVLPGVKQDFDDLAKFVSQVAQDWAPLGPLWLSSGASLLKIADAIAKINPDLVEMIPYLLLANKAFGAMKALQETGFLAKMASMLGGSGGVAAEADAATVSASKLSGALRGLAAIGTIGIIIAVTEELKGPITTGVNDVSNKVVGTTNNSAQLQTKYDQLYNAIKDNSTKVTQLNQSYSQAAKAFGFTLQENGPGTATASGGRPASNVVTGAVVAGVKKQTDAATSAYDSLTTVQKAEAQAATAAADKSAKAVVSAHTKAVAQITTDVTGAHTKGESELNTLLNTTESGSLKSLQTQLNKTHSDALKQIEANLKKTYTANGATETDQQKKSLETLNTQLVAAHKAALAKLNSDLVAVAKQKQATTLNNQSTLATDTANAIATQINDASQLANDENSGASGQQIALDQGQQYWDNQIGQLQLALDNANIGGNQLQIAQANNALATAQANSTVALASLNSAVTGLTTANSNATAAQSANTAALQAQANLPSDWANLATAQTAAAAPGLSGDALQAANAAVALAQQQLSQDQNIGQSTDTATGTQTSILQSTIANLQTTLGGNITSLGTDITGGTPISALSSAISAIKLPAPEVKVSVKMDSTEISAIITKTILKAARTTGSALGRYAGGNQTGAATTLTPNAVSR